MYSKGRIQITKARSMVVQQQPFFGPLVLQQEIIETNTVKTTATDGDHFYFNPEWAEATPSEYLRFAVAANGLTAGLRHPWRRGLRDPKRWNIASDVVVNIVLADSGFQLPSTAKYDPNHRGKSVEQVYEDLKNDQDDKDGNGPGAPQQGDAPAGSPPPGGQAPDYGGGGSIIDAPKTPESRQSEAQWKSRTMQAGEMARSRGNLPGELELLLQGLRKPTVSWKDLLWQYLVQPAADDQSWSRVNRRFVADGLYLPSLYSEGAGRLLMIIDASGSMPQKALDQSMSEVRAIAESMDAELDIMVHDVGVRAFFEDVEANVEISVRAGGGTSFVPAATKAMAKEYEAVVWFTDLYTNEKDFETVAKIPCPVVWLDYAPMTGKKVPGSNYVAVEIHDDD